MVEDCWSYLCQQKWFGRYLYPSDGNILWGGHTESIVEEVLPVDFSLYW